jgi:hypothetical protein
MASHVRLLTTFFLSPKPFNRAEWQHFKIVAGKLPGVKESHAYA